LKEKTMQQMSPALEIMIARAIVTARCDEEGSVLADPAELERALKGELGKLHRSRPRLLEFAPRIALQRVLTLPAIRRLMTRPQQPTPASMRRLYQAIAR
jgi:hypothetical protein